MGCDSYGNFICLELKAPGLENICRIEQFNFLKEKIEKGSFGLVVSCDDQLSKIYFKWLDIKRNGGDSISYLLGLLPRSVLIKSKRVKVSC